MGTVKDVEGLDLALKQTPLSRSPPHAKWRKDEGQIFIFPHAISRYLLLFSSVRLPICNFLWTTHAFFMIPFRIILSSFSLSLRGLFCSSRLGGRHSVLSCSCLGGVWQKVARYGQVRESGDAGMLHVDIEEVADGPKALSAGARIIAVINGPVALLSRRHVIKTTYISGCIQGLSLTPTASFFMQTLSTVAPNKKSDFSNKVWRLQRMVHLKWKVSRVLVNLKKKIKKYLFTRNLKHTNMIMILG